MNGGKVYNSLNYKLNNDVIKIIQRYTLPKQDSLLIYTLDDIEIHSFQKCKMCKQYIKVRKLQLRNDDEPDKHKFICYTCHIHWIN